jgi:hypothetical protein
MVVPSFDTRVDAGCVDLHLYGSAARIGGIKERLAAYGVELSWTGVTIMWYTVNSPTA